MGQTVKDILAVIHQNEYNIDVAKKNVATFFDILAKRVAPFQVGDITRIRSYAYIGQQGKITRLFCARTFSSDRDKERYRLGVVATVLKKNGEPGGHSTDWALAIDADGNLTGEIEGGQ